MWRRPTLPGVTPVPSALQGLTSLFGMGRGGTPALGRLVFLYQVQSTMYNAGYSVRYGTNILSSRSLYIVLGTWYSDS
jgi:hypothetical protein